MYLTGGQYKGFKINVPKSAKPTLSKVRESIFNILAQYDTQENKFLDMFAGSGIIGLEALSRGYIVTHLEKNPQNVKIIKENYNKIKVKPDVILCNALNYQNKTFDIIYIDPPWDIDYKPIISHALSLADKEAIIILEYDSLNKINLNEICIELNLKIIKSKKYGRCLIDFITFNY